MKCHLSSLDKLAELTKLLIATYHPDVLPNGLPPLRQANHSIHLIPDHKPPSVSPYKMNTVELKELKKQLDELLKQGFIRPSSSNYSAGCLFVDKKDGSRRLCIDYRRINTLTIKQKYAIPDIPVLLEQLQGSKVFSKLDLRSGYHQVRVEDNSIKYTAFTTRYGTFEWLVMPFGLCDAPSTFMSLLQSIFFDYLDSFVVVYLGDICIFSKSVEENIHHLQLVLNRLRENKLYAEFSKCSFYQTSISFLGHHISQQGIAPESDKIEAVMKWPTPQNKKEVQQFLGYANY